MNQKEHLFHLIHSLSKSERRYFSLYSSQQSGEKTYLKLFEAIAAQTHYNEAELLRTINDKKLNKRNLNVAKKYLNDQVLKSLRNYHTKISTNAEIQVALKSVEILYQKGLIDQAYKILRKLNRVAKRQERFGLLIEILNWERRINSINDFPPRKEEDIAREEQTVVEQQLNILNYQSLFAEVLEVKRKHGFLRDESGDIAQKIIASPLLQSVENALSTRAQHYYYFILSNYYYLVGKYEAGYHISANLPKLKREALDEIEYFNGLLERISSCLFFDQHEEALYYLHLIDEVQDSLAIGRFEQIKTKTFYFKSNYELSIFNMLGDTKRIRIKAKEVIEGLEKHKTKIRQEIKHVLQSTLSYAYFTIGDMKTANQFVSSILNESRKKVREDIYNGTRLMQLLVLAESEQFETLSYMAKSTLRHFNNLHKEEQHFTLEITLCNALRKLPDLTGKQEIQDFYRILKTEIDINITKGEYYSVDDFRLINMWIKSKVENKTYLQVVKENSPKLYFFPTV
jgi:hypothetical protein